MSDMTRIVIMVDERRQYAVCSSTLSVCARVRNMISSCLIFITIYKSNSTIIQHDWNNPLYRSLKFPSNHGNNSNKIVQEYTNHVRKQQVSIVQQIVLCIFRGTFQWPVNSRAGLRCWLNGQLLFIILHYIFNTFPSIIASYSVSTICDIIWTR